MGEIIVRVLGVFHDPNFHEWQFGQSSNLKLSQELKPNSKGHLRGSYVKINSQGLRDYEYLLQKPNNTFRIAVIGDSYTFGWGVNLPDTYPKILEKKLNQNFNINYEVINFGVPGYNLVMYKEILEKKVLKYDPDLIIIGLLDGDIDCLESCCCSGDLINATSYIFHEKYEIPTPGILLESYFIRFLKMNYNGFLENTGIRKPTDWLGIGLFDKDFLTWKSAQDNFKKIKEITDKPIMILILPDMTYKFHFKNLKFYPFEKQLAQLKEELKKDNFYIADPIEEYRQYVDNVSLLIINSNKYKEDGHPSPFAHNILANTLYNELINYSLVSKTNP